MRKFLIGIVAAAAMLAVPAGASASVNIDANGVGFVGKGNVQTAFGWNNAALQANASGVTFSYSQPTEQSVNEDAKQALTQSVTQSVERTLSCTVTTGGERNPKVFHNYGTRSGERVGERTGTRTGTRTGVINGTIDSMLDGDPRQVKGQKQFTGFILKGKLGSTFTPGTTVMNDAEYGEPVMSEDATMGETVWSGWVAEQGEHPSDCDREDNENDGKDVTDISDVTVVISTTDGDIDYSAAEQFSNTTYGPVTTTGVGTVSAIFGGISKVIWPVV